MFVPRSITGALERTLPAGVVRLLHRAYHPYYSWQAKRMTDQLLGLLFPSGDLSVLAGPFKGMAYISTSKGSALIPKLIGSYESEVHGAIETLVKRSPTRVIDIGCAEGYYLVGLAARLPNATFEGYDIDTDAISRCNDLATLNQVRPRINLHGLCTVEGLSRLLDRPTLVISDCEGAEQQLLDPEAVAGFEAADLLVELHEKIVPGISALIAKRFSSTHEVEFIDAKGRNPSDYPAVKALQHKDQWRALDEFRSEGMGWAVLRTRQR